MRAIGRLQRNRLRKVTRGNLKVAVANFSSLSNVHLAVCSNPDVALLQ